VPIVDASVVVDWIAPDADAEGPAAQCLRRLAEAETVIAAPPLLRQEVANALLSGVRRGRWDGVAADAAFSLLRTMPVRIDNEPSDLDQAWELSRRFDQHPIYDMVYVAMARRIGEPLVTADTRLIARLAQLDLAVAPEDWFPNDT
jgi:predicted nucleic acid-binding protein